jgi:Zinc finger, C3HC4 type (RING finger)
MNQTIQMLKPSMLLQRLFPTICNDNKVFIDNVNEKTTSNIIVSEDDTSEKLFQEAVEECIKDIINIIKEETQEKCMCSICLDSQTQPFMTSCNHSFCVSCLVRASEFKHTYKFPCPICRRPIENMADAFQLIQTIEHIRHLPPFNLENYPIFADFDFITEESGVRYMLMHAYNIITQENKWQFLRNYVPSPDKGFQWSSDPEINILMDKINDDYNNHSGCSLGYTMRKMHFISIYGFYEFKNEWCRWN